MTPPITGVAEVVLNVRDLTAMRDFYRDILGFDVHSEVSLEGAEADLDGAPTISFLTIARTDSPLGRHGHPQVLALIDVDRHALAKARFDGHEHRTSTLNHVAFEIPPDSYDAHKERLESLGVGVFEARFPAMNSKALFFEDPERNLLELICHVTEETET